MGKPTDELVIKSRSVRLMELKWITVILHSSALYLLYFRTIYPLLLVRCSSVQTLCHLKKTKNFDMMNRYNRNER